MVPTVPSDVAFGYWLAVLALLAAFLWAAALLVWAFKLRGLPRYRRLSEDDGFEWILDYAGEASK